MKKKTRATPAGIPRSRARLTRRERREWWERRLTTPIEDRMAAALYRYRRSPSERGARFVLNPVSYAEMKERLQAYMPEVPIRDINYMGVPVVCEPGMQWPDFALTSQITTTEQREMELWGRRYAMACWVGHKWELEGDIDRRQELFEDFFGRRRPWVNTKWLTVRGLGR